MLSIIIFSLLFLLMFIIISILYIQSRKKKIIERYISQIEQLQTKSTKNKPLMIIGPSGVGKDTFMKEIINKYPTIFTKCVSCTTRSPRKKEKEGINYYFISKEKFHELDKNGEIIGKFEKYNNLYGTSKKVLNSILTNDKIVYFDYNIETGIKTFNEHNDDFNYIALLPPSIEELGNRLRKRSSEDEESIQKRIVYAKKEIELINKSKFLNFVILNDDLDKAFEEFESCVKKLYFHLFE